MQLENKTARSSKRMSVEGIMNVMLANSLRGQSKSTRKKLSRINKGKKFSEETKRRMSIAALENRGGQKQWGDYCDEWCDKEYKDSIKERDGRCMNPWCTNGKLLRVHHINNEKRDCRPRNLITLCASCNSKAKGQREHWQALYQWLINGYYE
jgi:hypothetical protein